MRDFQPSGILTEGHFRPYNFCPSVCLFAFPSKRDWLAYFYLFVLKLDQCVFRHTNLWDKFEGDTGQILNVRSSAIFLFFVTVIESTAGSIVGPGLRASHQEGASRQ